MSLKDFYVYKLVFLLVVSLPLISADWQRLIDQNVIKGLVNSPSEADGVNIFNFGQIFEFSHSECERRCSESSNCTAYTQFASWHSDSSFFSSCMGRSNAFNVQVSDSDTLAGIFVGMLFPIASNLSYYVVSDEWQRLTGQNTVKGLVSRPSEADGIDVFNFGQVFEFNHDECERRCTAKAGCVAYTQFASWYPDVNFYVSCMGRSNTHGVMEPDSDALSGIRLGPSTSTVTPSTAMSTLPQATTASQLPPVPQFTVTTNGTAFTTDGAEVTPQCAAYYTSSMRGGTEDMAQTMNSMIGATLCLSSPDIRITTPSVTLQFSVNKSLMRHDYTLDVLTHHSPADIEQCSGDVANYAGAHSNWFRPILPGDSNCAEMNFVPERFDSYANHWNCLNQPGTSNQQGYSDNTLKYEIEVWDLYSTVDESELDVHCTQQYSLQLEDALNSVTDELRLSLEGGLCEIDTATVEGSSKAFASLGTQAYFESVFVILPSTKTFTSFYNCAELIEKHLTSRGTWGQLSTPPNCPTLIAEQEDLSSGEGRWKCY